MGGYELQFPLTIDEKNGFERYPIGGNGGDGAPDCDIPTPAQIKNWWTLHFLPMVKSSDHHDRALLAQYEADTETYIQSIV